MQLLWIIKKKVEQFSDWSKDTLEDNARLLIELCEKWDALGVYYYF